MILGMDGAWQPSATTLHTGHSKPRKSVNFKWAWLPLAFQEPCLDVCEPVSLLPRVVTSEFLVDLGRFYIS